MTLRPLHVAPRPPASVKADRRLAALRHQAGEPRTCQCGRAFLPGVDRPKFCSITCRERFRQ